jgi:hypothetical protein
VKKRVSVVREVVKKKGEGKRKKKKKKCEVERKGEKWEKESVGKKSVSGESVCEERECVRGVCVWVKGKKEVRVKREMKKKSRESKVRKRG